MTLTIDINDSVADKILYFLEHFKDDIRIVNKEALDISVVTPNDPDYQRLLNARLERENHPENYGTLDDIDWA